jgi:hypothetical protein
MGLLVLAGGCGNGSSVGFPDPLSEGKGLLIRPFVQNVSVPADLRQGSAFKIDLTLELPEGMDVNWLAGPERQYAPADLKITTDTGGGGTITIFPYLDASYPDGTWSQPTRVVAYDIPALPAGTYNLVYYGGATRDTSGELDPVSIPLFNEAEIAAMATRFSSKFTVAP